MKNPFKPKTENSNEAALRESFNKIKEELEEHLETINQNTNEIQANYEYLEKINQKMEKLNEKLEEIRIHLGMIKDDVSTAGQKFEATKLTIHEQEVFLVLYTASDFLSYKDIAKRKGLTESLVGNYITSLIEKGIPLIKKYMNKVAYVKLESRFKELQAKKNILKIDDKIARDYTGI
ncbi:hypothetical protein A3K72_02000 [Candidatus Woesearchaeota archaeon RBG_13_36_6]|nr:MAG: hypothetical protein A3K72_02000 [Candidatus Woesearchaeota archaeon RBG_13_36_6]